jgi:aspartyl-tRNA(Asn)/glutamyl-tRNA(Gln) amidotransferase subunit C
MSAITREEVVRIARLARIDLTEEETGRFAGQLESILSYMQTLSEVEIDGVEPFLNAAAEDNVFRADAPRPSLPNADALSNAPEADDGFFVVPRVT